MNDKNNEQDRHLQAPSEANRDKHINFLAEERGEPDPADEGKDKSAANEENTKPENVYAKDENRDRHLQAPTEANRDEHINFLAEERGEKDPADEGKSKNNNSSEDTDSNPVYTNSEAPEQQVGRDARGTMTKGKKEDKNSIYTEDDNPLQSKEEKQHDETVHPNKKDRVDVPDLRETEIGRSSEQRGQHAEKNP